jgi:hypothetical protein
MLENKAYATQQEMEALAQDLQLEDQIKSRMSGGPDGQDGPPEQPQAPAPEAPKAPEPPPAAPVNVHVNIPETRPAKTASKLNFIRDQSGKISGAQFDKGE